MEEKAIVPIPLDIKKTVKKSNMLNEIRNANATLVEYRLFCVYLAHLPMNSDSNVVTFTLSDYAKIAGLKRPRAEDLEDQSDNLLGLKAKIESPDGGFRKYTIFSEFALFKKEGEWMVSLECNSKIAPLIREQSGRFLRYKLYNTIFLKSFNQQRLYELLKQYERIGERTIGLHDLREFLSIADNEYPVWGDFSQKVLKVAQKALRENTDICFEFDPIRDNKRGKPVIAVKFAISKNTDYIDRLQIERHIQNTTEAGANVNYSGRAIHKKAPNDAGQDECTHSGTLIKIDEVSAIAEKLCKKLFPSLTKAGRDEITELTVSYFATKFPGDILPSEREIEAYLISKHGAMDRSHRINPIKSQRAYLRKVIKGDIDEAMQNRDAAHAKQGTVYDANGQRELDEDELQAIARLFEGDHSEPATAGSDPEIAARAAELQKKLQNT